MTRFENLLDDMQSSPTVKAAVLTLVNPMGTNEPTHMLAQDLQRSNEHLFNRKMIDRYLQEAILTNPQMVAKIDEGAQLLETWLEGEYYPSKNERLAQIKPMDLPSLVLSIFVGVAYCQIEELFVSVASQLATRLHFDERRDSIHTIAEILAVLCQTDVFDIIQPFEGSSLFVQSKIPLPQQLLTTIERSEYLPPMVCPPEIIRENHHSGYLTFNDHIMLGKGNNLGGDLCLDVINIQNQIPLRLAVDLIQEIPEVPTFELDEMEKIRNWAQFKKTSLYLYQLMISQGNRIWLTNKVDKRGRLYAQGYHITTQGTAFKKAIVELAEPELIQGVPT